MSARLWGDRAMSNGRLSGKSCIVTGGARGLGRAIAERFIAEGASVLITDIDQTEGQKAVAEIGADMLYTTNTDVPGIIGMLGKTMGENGVNIANFTLGRAEAGGEAIALLYVDEPVDAKVTSLLEATGVFTQVKPLAFDVA